MNSLTASIVLALTGLAALVAPGQAASAADYPTRTASCTDFINEAPAHVDCLWMTLPVDYSEQAAGQLQLPVLIARADQRRPASRAVLIPGGGGPGSPVGFGYRYEANEFLELYQPLLAAGFDLVFADQRGAGLARPSLACNEIIDSFKTVMESPISLSQAAQIERASAAACKRRLESDNLVLSQFDTRESARDFLAVMDFLPYAEWHVLATSYATAIAQAMLVERPLAFARVVLDSPVPLDYQQPLTHPLVVDAIAKTIRRCLAMEDCEKRYPRLATRFREVLERARSRAYKVAIRVADDDGKFRRRTILADDRVLAGMLFTALYSNSAIRQLPAVITRLHQGRPQALHDFAEEFWYQGTDTDFADGLYLTVHCKERLPLEQRYLDDHHDYWRQLDADSRHTLHNQKRICEDWLGPTAHRPAAAPASQFAAQTLVLTGLLDPIISNADVLNTVDNFDDASILRERDSGHSVWHQSECARIKVRNFLSAQNTQVTCPARALRFE